MPVILLRGYMKNAAEKRENAKNEKEKDQGVVRLFVKK